MSFKLVAIFSITIAVLCFLFILPWGFGVPGVQNEYARGWKIGLTVILLYPFSICLLYGSNLIIWILFLNRKLSTINLMRWQQGSTVLAIAILVLAILQMIRAFRIMSGN